MEFRSYRDADYPALCDFLVALNEPGREHINWNWARLEWMIEHPEFDRGSSGAIGLWLDDGKLVGAAVYDMYFGEAFCAALPEYFSLYPAILAYAWRELRDEAGLEIAIGEGNRAEIEAARSAGFIPTEQAETVMRRALSGGLSAALPEGFRFAELDHGKTDEVEALQWLFWRGFDHGDDRAEFEADLERTRRLGLQVRPHFERTLSLAALAPDGEAAAYCCLWHCPGTDYAYVEPVCTVPEYRGRGLAKALLFEAMDRAAARGAKEAFVISDMDFYKKLGFDIEKRFIFYRKD